MDDLVEAQDDGSCWVVFSFGDGCSLDGRWVQVRDLGFRWISGWGDDFGRWEDEDLICLWVVGEKRMGKGLGSLGDFRDEAMRERFARWGKGDDWWGFVSSHGMRFREFAWDEGLWVCTGWGFARRRWWMIWRLHFDLETLSCLWYHDKLWGLHFD